MSYSYTQPETATFTIAHARHMAAKVAADLKRMQRLYDAPGDAAIAEFEAEAVALLRNGYLGVVTYGFMRAGCFIVPTLRYTARELSDMSSASDDPGRIEPRADIRGATFYSYLVYSSSWHRLPEAERDAWPHARQGAPEPAANGDLLPDKVYSAGGKALDRTSLRSFP